MADGVDTSIYNHLQQPNPMQGLGQTVGVANQLAENKLLGISAQQNQFNLVNQQFNVLHNALGSLYNMPDLSIKDVQNQAVDLVKQGVISPQMAATEISNATAIGDDPQKLRSFVGQHLTNAMSAAENFNAQIGHPSFVNTGNRLLPVQTSPLGGIRQIGGGVSLAPSPGFVEGPTINTPNGPQKTTISTDQLWAINHGQAKFDPQTGRVVPVGQGGPANGPISLGPNTGPAGGASAPSAAPAAAAGAVPVGAPLGTPEAASVNAQASAQQGARLQSAADATPQRKAALGNLETDLEKFTSGPLAPTMLKANQAYNQVAGATGLPQINSESVAAHEAFNKQSTMLAQQQFAALGGTGTDQQLGSAFHSNPNDTLSKLGNQGIIALLKGNEDAISAKNAAWQKFKTQNGAASYGQFETDWNAHYSPRAFQWVYLNPQQRNDLYKSMSPTERKSVASALSYAEKNGWIQPPGSQSQNGQ